MKLLGSMIFDYFKNAKEALERATEENSVEELKIAMIAELAPSVMEYEDEQINLLITLIIKEYTDRYAIDYPIWREFANCVTKGKIV